MTESKICTCPSGDGSLVHPCPAHPAVEQAGGDELEKFLAWANKEYEVEEGYELNESNTSVLENKKGWMARAALAQPSPAQTQPSPAPTLRAAIDVANDRFEVPVAKWGTDLVGEEERPEVAEVAFVLRNIGAMDAEDIDGDNVDLRFEDAEGRDTGCDVSIVEYAEKAADLFEQHDRIVGELRADRDSWAEQAEQRLADWDEMRKERDAALARVSGLRSLLNPILCYVENDIERMRGDRDKSDNKEIYDLAISLAMERLKAAQHAVFTTEPGCDTAVELASHITAQAQHSVPDELRAICMLVAETGIKYGRGRHRAVAADECRAVVNAVLNADLSVGRACEYAGCCDKAHPGTSLCIAHHSKKAREQLLAAAPGKEGV
ncbi:hypothetical protein CP913_24075 [Pseudomonas aeruginosa]|uniref:hypothetical protein n=1 Tax=Pseudomonas aeruginosa TaxID=287 RepID=UPI000BC4DACF|nr:hypothetical protein [Pseudomonas aeruginosa]AXN27818.1 hypothetical protein CP913_24075 [Pseudomonas aeruginosa]PCN00074.1 hypothetical protein CP916_01820 [Pseudomonas aeruginosa]PCN06433.1 hypothetical protein CP915_03105 [Pseudomonas aeruginosa]PCN16785.1 hypothetical protein CP914_09795 [Pseudomonas aeruginosa]UFM90840.1 hypothetical protein LO758_07530 [Pseudomonas aeruginosa]